MADPGKSDVRKQLANHDSERKNDGEQQNMESKIKAYKETIIHTWIHLKGDINGISCFEKYFETQRLNRQNFQGLRCRSLSYINESFLLSVYHLIENVDDIMFFESCVSGNVVKMLHNLKREEGPYKQSDLVVSKSELRCSMLENREKMEKLLKPDDLWFIKDYFFQSEIIGIDENEELFKKMERSKYNSVLEILIEKIINKLDEGSFECFLSCLKNIVYEQKRRRPKSLIDSLTDKLPEKAKQILTMRPTLYRLYNTESGSSQSVEIHAQLQDTNGTDMSTVHERLKENQASLNKTLLPSCGLTVLKIDTGSVIINTRSLDRFAEEKLDKCLRSGEFASVIEMLFNDVDLLDCLKPGIYTLNVTVRSRYQKESYENLRNDTRPLDAISDNINFLVDEMDTELIIKGFERNGVTIFKNDSNIERKKLAHNIITLVTGKPELKETFLQILQYEQLEYMLNRLKTYEEIYRSDRNLMKKNIFVMFPVLADQVDFDDVKNTFLERNVLDKSVFNDIENKYESRRDLGMASLLVKILTSADITLPTFVDALHKSYLESLARTIIDKEPEVDISSRRIAEDEFAIEMVNKATGCILFEGSFELTVTCKDPSAYKVQKRHQETILLMEDLEKSLSEWISNTTTVITELRTLATNLDKHFRNINIGKISGSAGAIAGGILAAVGFALIPLSFGASLGLSIAGGALIAAGSLTVGGSTITDAVLSGDKRKEAETLLQKHDAYTKDVKLKGLKIGSTLKELGEIEELFPEWVTFWSKVVGLPEKERAVTWRSVNAIMAAEHKLSPETLRVGFIDVDTSIGRAAAVGLLLAPLNISTIVESAINIHKRNPNKVSENILSLANNLEKHCPTKTDSVVMIEQTNYKLMLCY